MKVWNNEREQYLRHWWYISNLVRSGDRGSIATIFWESPLEVSTEFWSRQYDIFIT